ncbi:hypothetical protein ACFLSJ_02645 [Verrucomicrobiota bacterium]
MNEQQPEEHELKDGTGPRGPRKLPIAIGMVVGAGVGVAIGCGFDTRNR